MRGLEEIIETNERATDVAFLRCALRDISLVLRATNGTLPHDAAKLIRSALAIAEQALEGQSNANA